ncbi:MAG TPA: DUF3999 family protein [Acidobacteriaceae bacterium]
MRLAATLLALAMATPAPQLRYFQYERAVLPAATSGQGQTCTVLDASVFAHAAPELGDLRLYHGPTEVPYVVRLAAPVPARPLAIVPLNLGVDGGETVFDAAMPEGTYNDVELDIAARDFLATVTVWGSQAPTATSKTKLGAYTIFDLTRQKLGHSTVLHLPDSNFAYLHFSLAGDVAPQSVTGLAVDRTPATQPKYETVASTSTAIERDRTSVYEFTIPAHVPVDRVTFAPDPAAGVFSRDVTITATPLPGRPATDASEPAQPVLSTGNILRVHSLQDGRQIDEEHLAIDAPRAEFDTPARWTVTIRNGDDPPVQPASVRLEMVQHALCFEAAPGVAYTLFYGDPALAAPQYDYAQLFTPHADAAAAVAGPETPNHAHVPRPDQRPFTDQHPALLWAALVIVLLLLGSVAWRSARPRQATG